MPSGERCRVSYTVSDSMSCRRRARVPVPCAALALRIARTDGLGDRFTVQPFTPTATGGSSCNNAQRRPDVRRHAAWPQSWIQRENWEFETHRIDRIDPAPYTVAHGRGHPRPRTTFVVDCRVGSAGLAAALLHESPLARTIPTDGILTCRCDMTLVDRGSSFD